MTGFGLYYFMGSESRDEASRKKANAASFSQPVEQVNAESLWIERMQNKLREQERQTAELKNELVRIKNTDNQKSIEADPRYQAMLKQNQLFQEALKSKRDEQKQLIQGSNAYDGQVVFNYTWCKNQYSTFQSA